MSLEEPPFLSLHRRLLNRIFWMALWCTGLAIAIQTADVYQEENQRFQSAVARIGEIHLPLLEMELWDLEIDALQRQLQQISTQPEVAQVVLESTTGLVLVAGSRAHTDTPEARLSIPHPRETQQSLGVLKIYANPSLLWQAVLAGALKHVVELGLFAALICLVIAYYLHHELGKALRQIARYAARLAPGQYVKPLVLARPSRPWHDEIDRVVEGFEHLRRHLQHYAQERDQAMKQLAFERDQLDARVARRTASLQRMNGYLDIFSQTLMRSIHLSLEGYRPALTHALHELADYIGADGCGLATYAYPDAWTWQVFWSLDGQAPYDLSDPLLEADPIHDGWLWDPRSIGVWAYALNNPLERHVLIFYTRRPDASKYSVDERRYQKMAAEMLFGLRERWQYVQQLETQRQELEHLSRTDPLTGLANRRHFDAYYYQSVQQALSSRSPLAVLVMDVDHFKSYNDQYGHAQGDDCLIQVAECLQQQVTDPAFPARLGGEEFVALFPHANFHQAQQAAEALCNNIRALAIEQRGAPLGCVTVSVGFAVLGEDLRDAADNDKAAQLLEQADQALYCAKNQGRNRVVGYEVNSVH